MTSRKVFDSIGIVAIAAVCSLFGLAVFAKAATYTITVDASKEMGAWDRFYEQLIATDHMHDMLHSAYGRNMQKALTRGANECGFKYFRGHGILNSDIALYSEPNGIPTYNWTKFDSVYDAAKAIGIRPIVEFSFTPVAMATGTATCLWYNGAPGNVTMPKSLPYWQNLCDSIVTHLENRYTPDSVRQWYFEVYNEPDLGTFFTGGQQGYFNLYDYASEGVRQADSLCKVGGPASSATNPSWLGAFLTHVLTGKNASSGLVGAKCDFLSYHRYADDPGDSSGTSNPAAENLYHESVVDTCVNHHFTGLIINDEWGPCATPLKYRNDESTASFVVQTIHLLSSNGPSYPAPFMYGYWCMSDIYEESDAWIDGPVNAYQQGDDNYGLTLRGDSAIPVSWDIAKPVFNAFKLLHQMTDIQLSCTGGSFSGANGFATLRSDTGAIQVMVYDHFGNNNVSLTVNNIPFSGPCEVQHFIVDSAHSNSYRPWIAMGGPNIPTVAQWQQLSNAAQLADSVIFDTLPSSGSYAASFAAPQHSVSLFVISSIAKIAVKYPNAPLVQIGNPISARIMNKTLFVTIPFAGHYDVSLFGVGGALVFKGKANGRSTTAFALKRIGGEAYLLKCANQFSSSVTKVMRVN